MIQIPRDKFIAAIEAGIKAQPSLTDEQREALRKVGRLTEQVGRLFFFPCFPGDPCCPATQAGLDNEGSWRFQRGYDEAIYPVLRAQGGGFMSMECEPAKIV